MEKPWPTPWPTPCLTPCPVIPDAPVTLRSLSHGAARRDPPGRVAVRVHWLTVDGRAAAAEARCRLLLDQGERRRAERFRFDRDRHLFVLAHGLLRAVLAGCCRRPAAELAFRTDANGRPELDPVPGDPPARFSLTHCDGLVAVAVAHGRAIGVDAEPACRPDLTLDLARQVFAPAEVAALTALPAADRPLALVETWTLKEALAKALGLGLGLPFEGFAVDRSGPALLVPPDGTTADAWHLETIRPTPQHCLSLAVERRGGGAVRVQSVAADIDALIDGAPGPTGPTDERPTSERTR